MKGVKFAMTEEQFLKTKSMLYKGLEANQYVLPSLGSKLCTSEFLKGVKDKSIFCLNKTKGMHNYNVINKKTYGYMLTTCIHNLREAAKYKTPMHGATPSNLNLLAEHMSQRQPDAAFVISLLSTLHANGFQSELFIAKTTSQS